MDALSLKAVPDLAGRVVSCVAALDELLTTSGRAPPDRQAETLRELSLAVDELRAAVEPYRALLARARDARPADAKAVVDLGLAGGTSAAEAVWKLGSGVVATARGGNATELSDALRRIEWGRVRRALPMVQAEVYALGAEAPASDPTTPATSANGDDGQVSVTTAEAEATARRLDKKDPRFRLGTAKQWAAAISQATRKRCGETTVKKLDLWNEVMDASGRGRSKGRPSKPLRGDAIASARDDTTPQDRLILEETLAEAKRILAETSLGTDEREAILEQVARGDSDLEKVRQITAEYPKRKPRPARRGASRD